MRKLLFFITTIMFLSLTFFAISSEQVAVTSPVQVPTGPDLTPVLQTETQMAVTEQTDAQTDVEVPEEPDSVFMPVQQLVAYNNELQVYLTDQTEIDDNLIRLTADLIDGDYVSGKAESRKAFRYGTFSFRIRTTKTKGMFPAIWMLPADGHLLPEVDVYEAIGSEPYIFYGGIHYDSTEGKKDFFSHRISREMTNGSYVLTFEWSPGMMVWYVDGGEVGRITQDCPDMPMYLICNLAVGGSWGGLPRDDSFPQVFEIEVLEASPVEVFDR